MHRSTQPAAAQPDATSAAVAVPAAAQPDATSATAQPNAAKPAAP
jgi:hypothetical protein